MVLGQAVMYSSLGGDSGGLGFITEYTLLFSIFAQLGGFVCISGETGGCICIEMLHRQFPVRYHSLLSSTVTCIQWRSAIMGDRQSLLPLQSLFDALQIVRGINLYDPSDFRLASKQLFGPGVQHTHFLGTGWREVVQHDIRHRESARVLSRSVSSCERKRAIGPN